MGAIIAKKSQAFYILFPLNTLLHMVMANTKRKKPRPQTKVIPHSPDISSEHMVPKAGF